MTTRYEVTPGQADAVTKASADYVKALRKAGLPVGGGVKVNITVDDTSAVKSAILARELEAIRMGELAETTRERDMAAYYTRRARELREGDN